MGGERASTARARLEGRSCCLCKTPLGVPERHGERLCAKCEEKRKPKRKVYLHFMLRDGWFCQFLEEDLKTPIPKRLTLTDSAKIIEMAERGGASMRLEDRQAIEYAISQGRGSVWLNLTDEQYQKLRRGR